VGPFVKNLISNKKFHAELTKEVNEIEKNYQKRPAEIKAAKI